MTLSNAFLFFAYSGCFFLSCIATFQLDLIGPVHKVIDDGLRIDAILEHLFYSRDVSPVA